MSMLNKPAAHELPRSAAGKRNPWLMAIVASIATFMELLDSTIANVSLYHISASLSVSYNESLWVLTSYIVANALVLPISGWLSGMLGRKRYYMLSIAGFTLGSLFCSIAPNLECLIVARVIQGICGGGLAPVEQSMLTDSFPAEKRAQVFAFYGVTVLFAPAIGPFVGGWLTENLSWHWVFLINVPVGILSLLLSYYFIIEPPLLVAERRQRQAGGWRIDYIGLSLVVVGFGALQLFLDRFEIYDGFSSSLIITLAVTAGFSLGLLVLWEWFCPAPVMNIHLLRHRNFALSCALIFLLGMLVYGSTQLLPQMTQELFGYTATLAGKMLGIGGLFLIGSVTLMGRVAGRVAHQQWLVAIGLAGVAWSTWRFSALNLDTDFSTFVLARIVQVIWFPVLLIPVSTLAYEGLPENSSNEAAAFAALMRNIGGSVGIALVANVLHMRTNLHYSRISENITGATQFSLPLDELRTLALSQARIMGYMDIFWLLAAICLLSIPLAFWFRRTTTVRRVSGHV